MLRKSSSSGNKLYCVSFLFLLFSFLTYQKKIVNMRIVVTTESDDLYNLEIDSQMAIEDLKALLETEVRNQHVVSCLYYFLPM